MDHRRRDLLRAGAGLTGALLAVTPTVGCARGGSGAGAGGAGPIAGSPPPGPPTRSPPTLARGRAARARRNHRRPRCARAALPGASGCGKKVNCLAGRLMSTHLELVEELVALLASTGLPRQNAIVFDRSDGNLRRGGYPVREGGSDYRSLGEAGYESELTVMPSGAAARAGRDREGLGPDRPAGAQGPRDRRRLGRAQEQLRAHPQPEQVPPHRLRPSEFAEVNALDPVRRKQRLVICDALTVQTDGGPGYHPATAAREGVLLFAFDPVAHDVIAWELLRAAAGRAEAADPRRGEAAANPHRPGAARARLGVGDRQADRPRRAQGELMPERADRRRFLRAAGGALGGIALASRPLRARAATSVPGHPARFYKKLPLKRVECQLCPKLCRVDDTERGFCGVRENVGGEYRTLVYSRACAMNVDPIEKKPLFHFLPGAWTFSIATAGCNMDCKACQNWRISQSRPEQVRS